MPIETLSTVVNLRAAADLLEAHPTLPRAYVTASDTYAVAHWFLHLQDSTVDDQHATALTIFDAIGGTWQQEDRDSSDGRPITAWRQQVGLVLVTVQAERRTLKAVPA